MNLTCWDETLESEKVRKKLKEIRYKHDHTTDEDVKFRLVSEYQCIAMNIDRATLLRWSKRI